MSIKSVARALELDSISATEKLICITLANCQNPETGACFPSHRYIAERALCSVRSVQRALVKLRRPRPGYPDGLVSWLEGAAGGHSNDYTLHFLEPPEPDVNEKAGSAGPVMSRRQGYV